MQLQELTNLKEEIDRKRPQEERLDYYLALEQADNGDITPFIELIKLAVERSLKTMAEVLNR